MANLKVVIVNLTKVTRSRLSKRKFIFSVKNTFNRKTARYLTEIHRLLIHGEIKQNKITFTSN